MKKAWSVLTVLLIALVLGGGYFYFYSRPKTTFQAQSVEQTPSNASSTVATSNLKTYSNVKYGYSFQYPDISTSTPDEKNFGSNCAAFPLEPLNAFLEVCHSHVHPYPTLSVSHDPLLKWVKGNSYFWLEGQSYFDTWQEVHDYLVQNNVQEVSITIPGAEEAVRAIYKGSYDNIFIKNGDDLFWLKYFARDNGTPSSIPQQILDSWKFIPATGSNDVVDVFPAYGDLTGVSLALSWISKTSSLIDKYGKDASTIDPKLITMTKSQLGIDPSYEFGMNSPTHTVNLPDNRDIFVVTGIGPRQSADILIAAYDLSANKAYVVKEVYEGRNAQIFGKPDKAIENILLKFYSCTARDARGKVNSVGQDCKSVVE